MAKLTGKMIEAEVAAGRIVIDPFDPSRVSPNSYDLRLGRTLKVFDRSVEGRINNPLDPSRVTSLDMRAITIPEGGQVLYPGRVYLASTLERAGSTHYISAIQGRSSIARLGLFSHVCAGFGDVGFVNHWTLELVATEPVRVFAGMRIVQIYFDECIGEVTQYKSSYNEPDPEPKASKIWREADEWK